MKRPHFCFHTLIISLDRRELFDDFFDRTRVLSYYNKVYFQPLAFLGELSFLQSTTINLCTERDVNMVMLMVLVGDPCLIH